MLRNCLKPMMLKDLIDDKIPRPGKDDPLYRRWVFWSTSVAAWMNLQVDKGIRQRIQGLAEEIDYADDLFKEIVSYVRGGNRSDNIMINMYKLDDMRRDHYSSAEEYITDFKTQMNVLRKVKLALHPWWAIGLMIRQLQDELPGIAFIQDRLGKVLEPDKMTHSDFDEYYMELSIKARQLAANTNKTHSARQNGPRNNRHDAKNPANAADPPNQYSQSDRGGRGRGGGGNNRAGQRGRGRGRGGRGDKAWP
jgi:hypothetical protein